MEKNLYTILFTICVLFALLCIIFLVIGSFEIYFKCQERTSAKIHPEKNETIKSNYSDEVNINPMFITIK